MSSIDPGVLEVTLGLVALPDRVDWNDEVLEADTFALGVGAGAKVARWNPWDSPHALICGATGSGKGVLLRSVIYQAVKAGDWQVSVVNPKLTGEYLCFGEAISEASSLEEITKLVRATQTAPRSNRCNCSGSTKTTNAYVPASKRRSRAGVARHVCLEAQWRALEGCVGKPPGTANPRNRSRACPCFLEDKKN